MTWLGVLNFVILQWFLIRLAKQVEGQPGEYKTVGWKIIGPILPLTGWWSNYIWLGKKRPW